MSVQYVLQREVSEHLPYCILCYIETQYMNVVDSGRQGSQSSLLGYLSLGASVAELIPC
jgi:hypothetical protein